jgi:hypothetical protein
VPRFPQHDRFLAVHPVGISDRDRGFDCTHDAIVGGRLRPGSAVQVRKTLLFIAG